MIPEEDIRKSVSDHGMEDPAVAEAAYMSVQGFKSENIGKILTLRYGDAKGYSEFEAILTELSGHQINSDRRIKMVIDGSKKKLENVKVGDIGIKLDTVVENEFNEVVDKRLADEVREAIGNLETDVQLFVNIIHGGFRLGIFDDKVYENDLFEIASIISNERIPEYRRESIVDSLIEAGVVYDNGNLVVTPMTKHIDEVPGSISWNSDGGSRSGH